MSGAIRSTTNNLGLGVINFNFPNWGDDANNNTKILDAAFQLAGVSISGVWENATEYTQGQLLVDVDTNDPYRALVTHTSASDGVFSADRVTNPTYWELVETDFHIRGEWAGATAYLVGDIVYDLTQHCVAVAVVAHTSGSTLRDDEALGYWQFIVDMYDAVAAAEAAAIAAAESAAVASEIAVGDLGAAIAGAPNKAALVSGDRFGITDSESSHVLTHTTFGDITTLLNAQYDAAYADIAHVHATADITGLIAALDAKASLAGATFTGEVNFASTVNLAGDPASGLHPATKQYVDGLVSGLGTRTSVRVATTANITISTALNNGDTLDGVVLATGNLVLVKDQTLPQENGIYVVGTVPARDAAFDTYNEHVGVQISVQEGTVGADTIWLSYANTGGTLNTTSIPFVRLVTSGELLATNNLSDLANAATARTNLGISANGQSLIATTYASMLTLLGLDSGDDPQFNTLNVGHASDTTLSRSAAGFLALEGKPIPSPASQAVGDLLVRGTTQWDRLAKGTALKYLRVNAAGTGLEYATFPTITTPDYDAGIIAIAAGAVGSFVFAEKNSASSVVFGGSIAGSSLSAASASASGISSSGSALSGTWRCLGSIPSSFEYGTLFLRTS